MDLVRCKSKCRPLKTKVRPLKLNDVSRRGRILSRVLLLPEVFVLSKNSRHWRVVHVYVIYPRCFTKDDAILNRIRLPFVPSSGGNLHGRRGNRLDYWSGGKPADAGLLRKIRWEA